MPKKAPGDRIANFLNLNQCTIKYQNCQKRLQGKGLIIKVPKMAPGFVIFLDPKGSGLKNQNERKLFAEELHTVRDYKI